MRQRVYVDTSVIGGCFDTEFAKSSNRLFDLFKNGEMTMLISDLTLRELQPAPEEVKQIVLDIPEVFKEFVVFSDDADKLAEEYLSIGIVTRKYIVDAQHIALATVELADLLVSWNFKHIVNFRKIRAFNGINLISGYKELDIRAPQEVIYGD